MAKPARACTKYLVNNNDVIFIISSKHSTPRKKEYNVLNYNDGLIIIFTGLVKKCHSKFFLVNNIK